MRGVGLSSILFAGTTCIFLQLFLFQDLSRAGRFVYSFHFNKYDISLPRIAVMPPQPSALIVPAVKKHTATVIMAHGLGDSGAGWVTLAENWRLRAKFEEVKFIFPNAPAIPITVVRTPPVNFPTTKLKLTARRTLECRCPAGTIL